jgi:hypothetical protein
LAKVFISHRGSDLPVAERLAAELRRAGHAVWLDAWALGPGDSVVGGMNQGLADATHVVVCYSAAGIDSPWMAREWMSALARQLAGQGVRILPVLLPGGSPPAILADLKYVDLDQSWSAGVGELLRALR